MPERQWRGDTRHGCAPKRALMAHGPPDAWLGLGGTPGDAWGAAGPHELSQSCPQQLRLAIKRVPAKDVVGINGASTPLGIARTWCVDG